jgi:hypothetical protein
VLFVPSGWHHSVCNEVDTLSINHNWINGHNLHHSWALLKHEHKLATQNLEDCRYVRSWTWLSGSGGGGGRRGQNGHVELCETKSQIW